MSEEIAKSPPNTENAQYNEDNTETAPKRPSKIRKISGKVLKRLSHPPHFGHHHNATGEGHRGFAAKYLKKFSSSVDNPDFDEFGPYYSILHPVHCNAEEQRREKLLAENKANEPTKFELPEINLSEYLKFDQPNINLGEAIGYVLPRKQSEAQIQIEHPEKKSYAQIEVEHPEKKSHAQIEFEQTGKKSHAQVDFHHPEKKSHASINFEYPEKKSQGQINLETPVKMSRGQVHPNMPSNRSSEVRFDKSHDTLRTEKSRERMKYDPSFQGPIKNRSCTDVICCLVFVAFFSGMIAVGVFAFAKGDPRKLLNPTDTMGNLCGMGNLRDKPNLFFFDALECAKVGAAILSKGCPTPQVCVKKCPNKKFTWLLAKKDKKFRKDLICKENIDTVRSSKSVEKLVENEDCAAYYIESTPVFGRCIPTVLTKGGKAVEKILTNENHIITDKSGKAVNGTLLRKGSKYIDKLLHAVGYVMQIYQDVAATWEMILLFLAMAMLISLIWITLMRWITGPMVWLSLIAFAGGFGFATGYCVYKFFTLGGEEDMMKDLEFTTNFSNYREMPLMWLLLGAVVGIMLLVVLVVLIFLRSQIKIAIALIKETSRAVGSMIFIVFWPIIPFVLELGLFAYWGASVIYLASIGEPQYGLANKSDSGKSAAGAIKDEINEMIERIPCNPGINDTKGSICTFLKYGGEEYIPYLQVFQLFMMFWSINFVLALGQMVLAGSFATYYWTFNKPKGIPACPVVGSLLRAFRYHVGSLAFGALIIAIIQIIRVILDYINSKLKGAENAVAKFCVCCCQCCFWCLEKFMHFVNKNAYIMIAVYGKNFCTSAKNAFLLLTRNIARVAAVGNCTNLILLLGQLVVVGIVGGVAGLYFKGYRHSLHSYFVPIIVVAIGSYMVAAVFFSVYEMGVDTLFLCFLEDIEKNDGSAEKPYYMSKELKDILGKKNKTISVQTLSK